jgi:hypothetical protein
MLFIFLAFGIAVVVWAVVIKMATNAEAGEKERAREQTRLAVRRTIGLEIDGDPIRSCSMRGNVHGVDLTIDVRTTRALPGPSETSESATSVSGHAPLPEQIVCRSADVDKVMGPLPAVPRQPTGDATFDASYAVFVGAGAAAQPPTGYRDAAPTAPAVVWADPKTLADMHAQRLIFMRVDNGRCELAFEPRSADDVAPLVATAANVIRRASGQPRVSPQMETTTVTPAIAYDSVTGVMFAGLASILVSPIGATLAFLPSLREINAEAECGKGGEIRVSSSNLGDGTSYGLYCSNNHEASLVGHYASALALFFTLVLGAVTLVGLSRWPAKVRA